MGWCEDARSQVGMNTTLRYTCADWRKVMSWDVPNQLLNTLRCSTSATLQIGSVWWWWSWSSSSTWSSVWHSVPLHYTFPPLFREMKIVDPNRICKDLWSGDASNVVSNVVSNFVSNVVSLYPMFPQPYSFISFVVAIWNAWIGFFFGAIFWIISL